MGGEIWPKMEFNTPYNYAQEGTLNYKNENIFLCLSWDHVFNSNNIHFIHCKDSSYVSRHLAFCGRKPILEYGETVFIKGL